MGGGGGQLHVGACRARSVRASPVLAGEVLTSHPPAALTALVKRHRDPPAAADEDQRRGRGGVGQVAGDRFGVGTRPCPDLPDDDDPPLGAEGRRRRRTEGRRHDRRTVAGRRRRRRRRPGTPGRTPRGPGSGRRRRAVRRSSAFVASVRKRASSPTTGGRAGAALFGAPVDGAARRSRIRSTRRTTRTVPATSWTRTIRQPWAHAVGHGGQRRRPADVDGEVEEDAEERLVGGRQQQRVAERRQPVALPEQHGALRPRSCRGRGRRRASIWSDGQPGGAGPPGPVDQEGGDVADEIVVVRLRVAHPGGEADVGGHHRRAGAGGGGQVVGVAEAADVIADHRAGGAGGGEDVGVPGIGRDRHVEPGSTSASTAGTTRSSSSCFAHRRARPGLDAPTSRMSAPSATSASARRRVRSRANVAPWS